MTSSTPRRAFSDRLAGFARNLALVAASLALCFVVLEIVFRLLAPSQAPGTTYGRPVARNADGFRDHAFAMPKPAGTYRILVLGDSFTWGVGLDVEETVPKLLEAELAGQAAGPVEVVNASQSGTNTVEQWMLLRERGMKYQPDLVLLLYNLNDIEYIPHLSPEPYEDKAPTPVVEIDPGEDLTQYSRERGLRGFILRIERHSVFVRFLVPRVGTLLRRMGLIESVEFSWVEKLFQGYTDDNPGWLESKRALREIAALCRAAGCRFVVGVYPLFVELDQYKGKHVHRTIVDFCREDGIRAVDLLPVFEHTRAQSHWINFLDSHPNAAAHRAVAAALLPVVREQMQARQRAARNPSG